MKPVPRHHRPASAEVFLPDGDERLHELHAAMKRHQYQPSALLEILHVAQRLYGHLPRETLGFIARGLRLPPGKVYGVATFYHMFSLQPRGQHSCTVCLGTACYMHGGGILLQLAEKASGVAAGTTRPDQGLTLQVARCLGVCGLAPVVVYDGRTAGQENPDTLLKQLKGWAIG